MCMIKEKKRRAGICFLRYTVHIMWKVCALFLKKNGKEQNTLLSFQCRRTGRLHERLVRVERRKNQ